MAEHFRLRRRRIFPYCVALGFCVGLGQLRDRWTRERSTDWYDRIVLQTFDNSQWIENFRMRRRTFEMLCNDLDDYLAPKEKIVRQPLGVQKQVAITLYWLSSTTDYRTIGNLFGVGKSTVCESVHKVCSAINDNLLQRYVSFPSGEDLKTVIRGYKDRWGFPNCGGAIDGTHVPIIAPAEAHGDYLNRKGYYSLVMQAVCDHKYIFRNINIGWPGRVHDARIFANSEIFHMGENGTLFPNWDKRVQFQGREISMPIVLLGDPAYPLKPWLMKPFSNRANLQRLQHDFNYRLSRARMTIENSFGRLKGRWKCLSKRLDVDVKFACTVIATCVVLHNICELSNELYRAEWDEDNNEDDDNDDVLDDDVEATEYPCAKQLRDDLVLCFANDLI